jgi:hypothetical protein
MAASATAMSPAGVNGVLVRIARGRVGGLLEINWRRE